MSTVKASKVMGWRVLPLALLAGTAALALTTRPDAGWRDVLDTPAAPSALAQRGLFNGLGRAGERLVAVGQRGHVLWSDDQGQGWHQAQVPVGSDLLAVSFAGAAQGWAVGHDGVVLHSQDGGQSWLRQLDGRELGHLVKDHYQPGADLGLSAEQQAFWQREAGRFADQGAEASFLDVWFEDERTGYVVGAFGLILRTRDGGRHWEPLMHRLDNPKSLHLYAVRRVGGALYVVGEQGLVLRQEGAEGRFRALDLPYQGTLFGIAGSGPAIVVHGLRGHVLRSTDAGISWQSVPTGLEVGLTGSATGRDGRLVLVSQAGHLLVSEDAGASFQTLALDRPQPAASVLEAAPHRYVVAGPRGVDVRTLR